MVLFRMFYLRFSCWRSSLPWNLGNLRHNIILFFVPYKKKKNLLKICFGCQSLFALQLNPCSHGFGMPGQPQEMPHRSLCSQLSHLCQPQALASTRRWEHQYRKPSIHGWSITTGVSRTKKISQGLLAVQVLPSAGYQEFSLLDELKACERMLINTISPRTCAL